MIDAEKATYPVTMMCALLRVPRSTYYDWSARGQRVSPTAARRAQLAVLVMQIFDEFLEVYGARRIARVLAERGHPVSPGTVAQLMRAQHLVAVQPRAYKVTTIHGQDDHPVADLIGRDFTAQAPGQRLVGDITYLRTGQGWCYLATVIDLCTRMVVGWAIAAHMRTSLVTDALQMARAGGHLPPGAVFHSDRGTQGGFNWSSQHLDDGGVWWRRDRSVRQGARRVRRMVGGGSGRRIGRCGRRCARLAARSHRVRCSGRSGGRSPRA